MRAPAALVALVATAAAYALGCAAAQATTVTVRVRTAAGAPAADAVVVFEPLDRHAPVAPAHPEAVIDQIHKLFVPHVKVIRTGTAVWFPNSDRIRHQVYSFSPAKTFSLKLYAGAPKKAVVFDKPGLVVLGCNIHDSMIAFVLVVDTPYFAKVPASGDAQLALPAGRYRMRLWDESLSAPVPPRTVVVGDSPLDLPVTLELSATPDPAAAWP